VLLLTSVFSETDVNLPMLNVYFLVVSGKTNLPVTWDRYEKKHRSNSTTKEKFQKKKRKRDKSLKEVG